MDLTQISWYMKYCPKTIADYVFDNNELETLVNKWIEQDYIDGNILFSGPAGVGKTALSELLIKSLIKHEYDLKVIKSRSVNQIDELYSWCQISTVGSKKKIVYIEEFDKLSSTAHTSLKDSILEKFQDNVTFICNTNFINKLDPAILSRFNYKFVLHGNKEQSLERLMFILRAENIHFKEELLKDFVSENYRKGLRNLITSIQMGSITGILNLEDNIIDALEDDIVRLTHEIFTKLMGLNKLELRRIVLIDPINSVVSKEYGTLLDIIQFNNDIDWDKVFLDLNDKISYLPVKMCISKYIESIDNKKIPYIHYISFLYETMRSLMEIS
jgi:DNA polymerase III delta prime subunit